MCTEEHGYALIRIYGREVVRGTSVPRCLLGTTLSDQLQETVDMSQETSGDKVATRT